VLGRRANSSDETRSPSAPSAEDGANAFSAFISYSRAADQALAQALHQGLERFAKPWYRLRTLHVFRDDSSLSANPGLWPSIQAALAGSRFFVLLASPAAAKSEWVERETAYWLEGHDPSNFLIALTEGEIAWDAEEGDFDWERTTALPRGLRGRFDAEPRYADLRWARASGKVSLADLRFQVAVADLAAPMHGKPKDELVGENLRQHRRTLRLARSAVMALATLALVASAAGVIAIGQRDEARRQRNVAMEQERLAVSRQLAAQALMDLPQHPDRALLLSAESLKASDGLHGQNALLTSLQRVSNARSYLDNETPVMSLTYSPDGSLLATGHNDRSIRIWDVASGRALGEPLGNNTLLVTSLAFSPDGATLASINRDGAIVLHDVATRRLHGPPFASDVSAIAFDPRGRRLAAGTRFGDIQLWDVETTQPVSGWQDFPEGAFAGSIDQLAWAPDGSLLAAGNHRGRVVLRDGATGSVVATPVADTDILVRSVAFSPDGATLALGTADGPIVLWDTATRGARQQKLTRHTGAVLSLSFSRVARLAVSGGQDGLVVVWNLATAEAFNPLQGHGDAVRAVAFRPNGDEIASGSFDGSVVMWGSNRLFREITKDEQDLRSVAYSADLTRLVFGYGNGNLFVWDLPGTGPSGGPLRQDGHVPETLAVSHDGSMAVSGDGTGSFVLWDLDRRQAVGTPLRSPESQLGVTFLLGQLHTATAASEFHQAFQKAVLSPDGTLVATVSRDRQIMLWDRRKQQPLGDPLVGHDGPVGSLAFSPNGRLLASGDLTGGIVLWDAVSRQPLGAPLTGHNQLVEALAFSRDGRLLASGGADDTVLLWDVDRRQPVGPPLRGHSAAVGNLTFSPDGKVLVSAGNDGSLLLWDVARRQRFGEPLSWHTSRVLNAVFHPDGKTLATASKEGTLQWDVDPRSWRNAACGIANRNLTRGEWDEVFGSGRPYKRTCPQHAPGRGV
jgi:WD40 repeat protein